ncbi:unnamed protein product [Didymodactylos carnosus]|uniref:KY-like immunoglobulin-like domain-containing protein n=1 Tax=Didymodactylos carnosus TaxID=1234261 RepID=A0A8S2H7V4_9BILA|nr:unnamed protein product [Didymodactylos carnosus]CAF3611678.1 unnamed protein product [Didymodactylos carnosus]
METEILIKSPKNVHLSGKLKTFDDQEISGSDQVYYNKHQDVWRCRFAPPRNGKYKILIYAKKITDTGTYPNVLEFELVATNLTLPISYPKVRQLFFDYEMQIIQPTNQYAIKSSVQTEVLIRAAKNIELIGTLTTLDEEKIPGSDQVYYNKHQDVWRCRFAPPRNGKYKILIYARKITDTGTYPNVLEFELLADNVTLPISYPKTWQSFYDYQMEIIAPNNSRYSVWPTNGSYSEILLGAPGNIELSSDIKQGDQKLDNGSLIQYDSTKNLYQCLFAPRNVGEHKLTIYAKPSSDTSASRLSAVEFDLKVTNLKRPIMFPLIYTQFNVDKCRIFEPLNGVLKQGSNVLIHCQIPDAQTVKLLVDKKWKTVDSYENNILKHQLKLTNEQQQAKCGYIVLILIIYWATECQPLPVTSVLPLFLFPMAGIIKSSEVALNYFQAKTEMAANNHPCININQLELDELIISGQIIFGFFQGFLLATAYSASIGGLATLVGSATNIIAKEFVDELFQCRPNTVVHEAQKQVQMALKIQYKQLGRVSWSEGTIGFLFIILLLLLITRDFGETRGWNAIFRLNYVTDGTIAILIGILPLIWPSTSPFKRNWKYKPILTWTELSSNLPWGTLLLLGAGLAIAEAFQKLLATFQLLAYFFLFLTLWYARTANIHPAYVILPCTLSVSLAFVFPTSSNPNSVVFASGTLHVWDMMKAGIVIKIMGFWSPTAVLILSRKLLIIRKNYRKYKNLSYTEKKSRMITKAWV